MYFAFSFCLYIFYKQKKHYRCAGRFRASSEEGERMKGTKGVRMYV